MSARFDVATFVKAMARKASNNGKTARLASIEAATPVLVPAQYILTSPHPIDHPGTWLPFDDTLFLTKLQDGLVVGSMMSVHALTSDFKMELLRFFSDPALGTPRSIGANVQVPSIEDTVSAASYAVKVWHVTGEETEPYVYGNSFWFANERREWSPLIMSVSSEEGAPRWIDWCHAVALSGMDLLSCKNVSLASESETVSRPQRKRGVVGLSWRTIILRGRVSVSSDGVPVRLEELPRLHECRGHFKEYVDRPLFGKHTGRFFWHPYLRGDLKRGAIVHDKYEFGGDVQ